MAKRLTRKVVKLKFPIVIDAEGIEKKIEKVVLKRPKLKQLRQLPDAFFDNEGKGLKASDLIPVLSGLTGLGEAEIDEIDFDDLEKICDTFSSFFVKSPQTSKK
jgi:hypothetical protein